MKLSTFLGTSLLLLLGLLNPADITDLLLSVALFVYTGGMVTGVWQKLLKTHAKHSTLVVMLPIVSIFLLSSWHNSFSIRKFLVHEPVAETYRSDLDDFLRTYYLMEQGKNYYESFSRAVAENAFKGYAAPNLWAWRLPTIFYIWKWWPGTNGMSIFYLFVIGSTVILFVAYSLVRALLGGQKQYAVIAPYLLYPYLHFGVRDAIMLHTDWWGAMFLFIGIFFFVRERFKLATLLFTLTVFIRELFILPLMITGAALWILKKRQWRYFLLPVGCLLFFLTLHSFYIKRFAFIDGGNLYTPRLHAIGTDIIVSTLAFGAGEYLFYKLRLFIIFYILGVFAFLRNRSARLSILASFFIFPLSFLFIGSSIYNDYWGILYMPFVLITIPLLYSRI